MGDKKQVTLTVNECSEFHTLGESHEGIKSVDQALKIWKKIPPERMRGIKSIGICVADMDNPKDCEEMDVIVGKFMDLDLLQYYPEITENKEAMDMIAELQEKFPNLEVIGALPNQMIEKSQDNKETEQSRRINRHHR